MSLILASNKTAASTNFNLFGFSLKLPIYEPAIPPIMPTVIQINRCWSNLNPPLTSADNPEREFRKINSADAAADSFTLAQWNKMIIGLKIIPPPIPIIPEKNPSIAPITTAGIKGIFIDFSVIALDINSIRPIEIRRNMPSMIL